MTGEVVDATERFRSASELGITQEFDATVLEFQRHEYKDSLGNENQDPILIHVGQKDFVELGGSLNGMYEEVKRILAGCDDFALRSIFASLMNNTITTIYNGERKEPSFVRMVKDGDGWSHVLALTSFSIQQAALAIKGVAVANDQSPRKEDLLAAALSQEYYSMIGSMISASAWQRSMYGRFIPGVSCFSPYDAKSVSIALVHDRLEWIGFKGSYHAESERFNAGLGRIGLKNSLIGLGIVNDTEAADSFSQMISLWYRLAIDRNNLSDSEVPPHILGEAYPYDIRDIHDTINKLKPIVEPKVSGATLLRYLDE